MLKIIITLIVLLATPMYANYLDQQLKHLSNKQRIVMSKVFIKAKKFNLEYTMTAIAWNESDFNKFQLNLSDPSCGLFHIMPSSLVKRTNLKDNSWNRSRLCERLMEDNDFSFSAALLELKYWQNYWKSRGVSRIWSHTVSSYNGGFTGNAIYLNKIKAKIKALKKYFKGI